MLHKQGYRFAERIGELTPLQCRFIEGCLLKEAESAEEPPSEKSEKAQVRDEMERKMRERRKELQWQLQQNS